MIIRAHALRMDGLFLFLLVAHAVYIYDVLYFSYTIIIIRYHLFMCRYGESLIAAWATALMAVEYLYIICSIMANDCLIIISYITILFYDILQSRRADANAVSRAERAVAPGAWERSEHIAKLRRPRLCQRRGAYTKSCAAIRCRATPALTRSLRYLIFLL